MGLLVTRVFTPHHLEEYKQRPKYIKFLKYFLFLGIFASFVASAVLLSYGPGIIEGRIAKGRTPGQIECLKKTWMIFLICNLVFCLFGFIGVYLEQVCLIFFFMIYSFFVSFGIFFDTINENHIFLSISIPVTLMAMIFLAIIRIERMDPPPPARKFSIYTNSTCA